MSDDLKPCPFCGGSASLCTKDRLYPWVVECEDCGASAGGSAYRNDGWNTERWNTRTDLVRALIEAAVKRALEGAASSLETRAFREQGAEKAFKEKGKHYKAREAAHFARCLNQLANTHIRQLDPAQFIDGGSDE